jgi:sterol desaturase/sphingolipid hydroxylase (fatty acid hydroxylase superfamily)
MVLPAEQMLAGAQAAAGLAVDALGIFLGVTLAVYVIPAGLFHLLVRRVDPARRIQSRPLKPAQVRHEVLASLRSMLLATAGGLAILLAWRQGHTALYAELGAWPLWWLPASLLLCFVAHETFTYWTHRAMHHPALFRWMHRQHHRSITPTPWSIFSYEVGEMLVLVVFYLALVWLLPLHPSVLFTFMVGSALVNALGHSGFEFMPAPGPGRPWMRWLLRVAHHDLHHSGCRGNFSTYTSVWDRICGTYVEPPALPVRAAVPPLSTAPATSG